MRAAAPGRVALICLAVLPAVVVPARAEGLIHKLFSCSTDCCADTQRVTIPAQQVEVVSEQPRVVVREVAPRRVHRTSSVGVVPLGTLYMPLAVQAPMVGAFTSGIAESAERNPLEVAHRAELMALRSEHARSELQATLEAHQRVLQRVGGPARSSNGSDGCSSSVDQKLTEIRTELQQLTSRVAAVEKLLVIHDNVLKAKVVGAAAAHPAADASTGSEDAKTPDPDKPKVYSQPQPGSSPPEMIPPGKPVGTPPQQGKPPTMMPPGR